MGLLDADIYGPSIPKLMNLKGNPELTDSTEHTHCFLLHTGEWQILRDSECLSSSQSDDPAH